MKPLDLDAVRDYVNNHIDEFHQSKIRSMETLKLKALLQRKNPYLFKSKNILLAQDMVRTLPDAHISSSEEEMFGQFLEGLAIFIAGQTCDGVKSVRVGIDLELVLRGMTMLVQIKSGPNWGNSTQQNKQEQNFRQAIEAVQLEQGPETKVEAILGICYGKTRTARLRGYLKVVGQNLWYLVSENEHLYTEIIEPLGYRAKEHTETFERQKAAVVNRFTQEFMSEFCDNGVINWERIVRFNSSNFDLPMFLSNE
ncbi:MAG: cytosolic protein [Burkholderiales bacterium]|nr:cytosolic protein [Anaerolineae bacterium]